MARPGNGQAEQATAPAARLTGRGAVLGMAVVFVMGLLVASWLNVTVLAGVFFVAGCALAAWYTRPADLLTVVLAPPLLFSGALIFVEAVTASGSVLLSVTAGSVVVLASLALWLAVGLVVTVAIAGPRGLPQCVRDLRRDLHAERARSAATRAPGSPRPGTPSRDPLRRSPRAEPAGPAPRGPGGPKAAGPGSKGPGNSKAAGPRGPGKAKAAGPAASRGPGSASRGPGSKSASHAPRVRQPEPDAPGIADEAPDLR
jgi:Domain of unknown function (DUF6542)